MLLNGVTPDGQSAQKLLVPGAAAQRCSARRLTRRPQLPTVLRTRTARVGSAPLGPRGAVPFVGRQDLHQAQAFSGISAFSARLASI
jgi:hypothetical protein